MLSSRMQWTRLPGFTKTPMDIPGAIHLTLFASAGIDVHGTGLDGDTRPSSYTFVRQGRGNSDGTEGVMAQRRMFGSMVQELCTSWLKDI